MALLRKMAKNSFFRVRDKFREHNSLILLVPICFAIFTHLWNVSEFPSIHNDEGIYLRRSLHALNTSSPQEPRSIYDHPFLGWLLLSGLFKLLGYPDSLNPSSSDIFSIQLLYLVPRFFVGCLAVLDTFLIFKIGERLWDRNSRTTSFIAAILFSVIPYNTFTRMVFLESLQLPFLLASILFALLVKKDKRLNYKFNISLTLISGSLLGLAILTKIPAFTFIPLIGLLIFRNNNRKLPMLGLWFIPVILLPLIWPTYSMYVGQFEIWAASIYYQTHRISKPLFDIINESYSKDPLFFILSMAGLAYATVTIKKNFLLLLWGLPYIMFLYFISYVSSFHLIPLIPVFCIAAANLLIGIANKITSGGILNSFPNFINNKARNNLSRILSIVAVTGIIIFSVLNTISSIIKNENSDVFKTISIASQSLPDRMVTSRDNGNSSNDYSLYDTSTNPDDVTIIGGQKYSWIMEYVLNKNQEDIYKNPHNWIGDDKLKGILNGDKKVLLIADDNFKKIMSKEDLRPTANSELIAETLSIVYERTRIIASFNGIEIRTNY